MTFRAAVLIVCVLGAGCSDHCALYDDEGSGECLPSRTCRGETLQAGFYDREHCGDGAQCVVCPDPLVANAFAACTAAHNCGWECKTLYGDCNGDAADGCETPLAEDPNNCGGCGVHCRVRCFDGGCEQRWEGETNVVALTDSNQPLNRPLFDDRVLRTIWLASDGGTLDVREGPSDGGTAFTLASVSAAPGVTPAATQGVNALWFTDGASGDGGVFRLTLESQSAAPERIASGQDGPGALLLTSDALYWTNYLGGQLMRAPLDGGAPQALARGLLHPRQLTTDGASVFWINEGADGGDGSVMAVSLTSGALTVVADGGAPESISFIATQSAEVPNAEVFVPVWADRTAHQVFVLNDGRPLAMLFPSSAPANWNPTQMFPANEFFALFDAAHPGVFSQDAFFVVHEPQQPPYTLLLDRPEPSNAISVSAPLQLFWTDGSTISNH